MAIHNQSRLAAYLANAATPTTNAGEGAHFVSDGSGGLVAGGLYFRPASNGTPVRTDVAVPITRTLYVDGARVDSYTETGAEAYPYKTVQAAVNYAEASMTPTANDPVAIMIAQKGPFYNETVLIKKSGIILKGNGIADRWDVFCNWGLPNSVTPPT